MILREGVNSPLMKFAEDIKLEGVVNANEDSKAVQGDLGGRTLAGDRAGGLCAGGGLSSSQSRLERPEREGHPQGWCR